ncbi:DEAD/DEAH box helicase [Dellaglioa sp. P0083]|uniref:DEAD/DEAH box helicase n=1 Tax=Dellaglioa kimchii TaxID=3344667 RepID=UPI0038D4DDA8
MALSSLYGRLITDSEIDETINLDELTAYPGISIEDKQLTCRRCLSQLSLKKNILQDDRYYCSCCMILGRISTATTLYTIPEPNLFSTQKGSPLTWNGQLTTCQEICANEVKQIFKNLGARHLLWAVTGAGKTEMLFKGIEAAIMDGKRICLASPRVDVCIELFPRLQAAFQNIDICLLHGKTTEPYRYTQLVICTTHQLLRFHKAFDVMIVDEVDAFPYAQNQLLLQATAQATKQNGASLFLTATPSEDLLKEVRLKQLTVSYLPIRFHGQLLPEIKIKFEKAWEKNLKKGRLPKKLTLKMTEWLKREDPFLIFVPKIWLLEPVIEAFKKKFPNLKGDTVYSEDPDRLDKVKAIRTGELRYLITTTILERGVTFANLDVFVLGADDKTFSTAALVQIAGRVGRNVNRPFGDVIFLCSDYTLSIKKAVGQIKTMNRKARKLKI